MKVKIEMHEDWRMTLSFEFMPAVLSLEQRLALSEQMRQVRTAFPSPPVTLLSFYEINRMWASGNGAQIETHKTIGTLRKLDYAPADLGDPNSTWLVAEINIHRNLGIVTVLADRACTSGVKSDWVIRDDFAVFPRMRVNAIPESQPRLGEQHPRMQFKGYGPILGLDCVYGVQRPKVMQSIADAAYQKNHARDLGPR
jgi:hypothetical protein